MRARTVCLIGTGVIGRHLLDAIRSGRAGPCEVVGIADTPAVERDLRELSVVTGIPYTIEPLSLLDRHPFVVVESASPAALTAYGIPALGSGAHLMAMSVGALADAAFAQRLVDAARRADRRVVLSSGAIGGLDAILAARQGDLREIMLVTTKPPGGLAGAPFFAEHPMDFATLRGATTVFEGSVADAIRGFPSNVNVAAALLVAAGGAPVRVRVVADPSATTNVHLVHVRGDFGEMRLEFRNQPSANPRTSRLALYAAVAALRQLHEPVQFV